MTDEPEDIAEFHLYAMGKRGGRELLMRVHDDRRAALAEIVKGWRACAKLGDKRAVFEIVLVPVDMSVIDEEPDEPARLIITLPERRQ